MYLSDTIERHRHFGHTDLLHAICQSSSTPSMLLTWQLNGIIASFVSMYTWSCNIKRPKGVIPEKAFYNALLALIDQQVVILLNVYTM